MAKLTEADMIWNRACGDDPLRALPGDRALRDLLRVHGLAMNGGMLHAVEYLTARDLSDAEAGYRFYGFNEVAFLIAHARKIFEQGDELDYHEHQLDAQYAGMVPSDSTLVNRFETHWKTSPSDYAPLREADIA
jgi:hypothetical protein